MEAAALAASLGLEVPGVRELNFPDEAQPHAMARAGSTCTSALQALRTTGPIASAERRAEHAAPALQPGCPRRREPAAWDSVSRSCSRCAGLRGAAVMC